MTTFIYIKTNRTRSGYAKGRLSRFMNYTDNKICYGFHFYQTNKFFDTYNELREYVENNYELLNFGKGMVEYHLPEDRKEFFR